MARIFGTGKRAQSATLASLRIDDDFAIINLCLIYKPPTIVGGVFLFAREGTAFYKAFSLLPYVVISHREALRVLR